MDNLELSFVLGMMFSILGFIVLVVMAIDFLRNKKRIKAFSCAVEATVTNKKGLYNRKASYRPTYEFYAEGKRHKISSRGSYRPQIAADNEIVQLYYLPGQPEKIYVPKERNSSRFMRIFLIIWGVFALVCGIGVFTGLMSL